MRKFHFNISLGKRIYFAMLGIIIVSSLVIGIFTVYFFKDQNEKYHLNRLKRKDEQIAVGIQYFLEKNDIKESLEVVPKNLYEKIEELSDVNSIGVNLYDLKGNILFAFASKDTASINEPLEINLEQFVLDSLASGNFVVFIEKINDNHLATYSYIRNKSNKEVAILKIPYHDFSSQSLEFNEFFKTLLEVYLFLLIGAGIFAYFISKTITNSLKTIGDSMNNISIDKKNEKIIWENKDEIGYLVEQYNNMIDQLEQSAELLAQSERETAWREMAKQVAHEIKNPLTPMKLNVQFLEQTLKPNTENFTEKLKKFSEKMIIQIDTLTNIANEFSSFAKMPTTSLEKIDLIEIIHLVNETFKNEISIDFPFQSHEKVFINGDKEQLTRIFNNLYKNAIQAIPEDRKGQITITCYTKSNQVTIEVKDNGKGIPPSEYSKIFTPNFTTKSSGSGLGLAMVKNIIKNHLGTISFESKVGEGTSFTLTFPLYN